MPDIVLFGATGYTGRMAAAALGRRGADFGVAGRNRARLEALAEETGAASVHQAEVGDVDSLAAALKGARALVTCVGPFLELGQTAVEAAFRAGVNYLDSTGEGEFIARLITEKDAPARAAGIALAPAIGFDEVPADLAATLAVEGIDGADLVLTYAMPSTGSRGTLRSVLGIALADAPWIENGRKRPVAAGAERRWAPMPPPLGPRSSVSFPTAEGHLAPLHLDLGGLRTYITAKSPQRIGMRAGLPVLRALQATPARGAIEKLIERAPEGPSDEIRSRQRWTILAEAQGRGTWRNVALTGTDPYGLTAELLAAGGMEMSAAGYDRSGVVAPTEALGVELARKELESFGVDIDLFAPN